MSLNLQQLAKELKLEFLGDAGLVVNGVASPKSAVAGELCFILDQKTLIATHYFYDIRLQQTVLTMHQIAKTLNETIPQLQIEYEDVVMILLGNDAPADQISVAERQSLRAERIVRSVNNILTGDEDAAIAANRFGEDSTLFGRVMNAMFDGNDAMGISKVTDEDAIYGLEAIAELFEFVDSNVKRSSGK